jgi:glucose/mannose-6-phosphate isomerase
MSYSGGTEESLSAFEDARIKKAQCLVITSGGELARRAEECRVPCVRIPGGLAPRMAFGSLFFPLLAFAAEIGLVDFSKEHINAAIDWAASLNDEYMDHQAARNIPRDLALELQDALPVIYCAQEPLEAVALRWRCQVEENAKSLAFGNVFPEMNHNEIVGWEMHPDLLKRFAVIILREPDEHPQITKRIETTKEILRPFAHSIRDVRPRAGDLFTYLLELLLLGDWFSYYLALINGVDPFPIEKIQKLKIALSESHT